VKTAVPCSLDIQTRAPSLTRPRVGTQRQKYLQYIHHIIDRALLIVRLCMANVTEYVCQVTRACL